MAFRARYGLYDQVANDAFHHRGHWRQDAMIRSYLTGLPRTMNECLTPSQVTAIYMYIFPRISVFRRSRFSAPPTIAMGNVMSLRYQNGAKQLPIVFIEEGMVAVISQYHKGLARDARYGEIERLVVMKATYVITDREGKHLGAWL